MRDASRRFLVVTVPPYLALSWLVSGLATHYGFWVFFWLLFLLALACFTFQRGQRRPLFALYLTAILVGSAVGVVELLLRVAPGLLHGAVANFAFNGYHAQPGGIYERDCHRGLTLRPSNDRRICWNGHWWNNGVNAAGWRGPLVDQADAVFLGDSMIYGHGVATDQTVPANFARRTGMSVANLGQQGTCPLNMLLRLQKEGTGLRPKLVFLCCHPNDLGEPRLWYAAEELERFLAEPLACEREPIALPKYQPLPWWRPEGMWNRYCAPGLWTAGALIGGWNSLRVRLKASAAPTWGAVATEPERFVPEAGVIESAFTPDDDPLTWNVHRRAMEKIADRCRQIGAQLVIFDLGYPRAFSVAMEAQAGHLGALYLPAGQVALEQCLAGEDIYLAQDGHWSSHGCEVVAEALAERVLAKQPATPSGR
jgi:hypothetical protein